MTPRVRRTAHRPTTTPEPRAAGVGSRFSDAGASPGFVLWQVATVWQRGVRAALDDVGLTHAQFVLLTSAAWLEALCARSTEDATPITQRDIAAHARTDAVMTSEVLRTLERRKLVRRRPHPSDARARSIAVTAEGQRLVRRAVPLVEAVDAAFFRTPGPELQALARVLCNAPATRT